MSWRDYWNADTPIYVNDRHKTLHYLGIARDIAALVPFPTAHVLDYGSGEALCADLVAQACGRLYLSDGAELVRTRLAARFSGNEKVVVLAPEEGDRIPDRSLDLIVVNSLLQYLDRAELERLLAQFRAKLKPGGRLILADVLPPGLSAVTDAMALLRFAARGRFLVAALAGLVRTVFSEYRTMRARLGLTHYAEAEMIALLRAAGFEAVRHHPNLGHNQARMAFRAVKPLAA